MSDPAAEAATGRPVLYLHIGAPKTGTTYLQSALWKNREALRADGVLFPGQKLGSHTHATLDLQGRFFGGYPDPRIPGAWKQLVEELRKWNGTAIVSQELLASSYPDMVDRALASLDFAEVHLVFTARDLVRQVPAVWQENLKNREVVSFREFLDDLQAPLPVMELPPPARRFWRVQDTVDVLARWARDIPAERVHVVTLPQGRASATHALWARFCEVTGLDPDRYDLSGAAANTSIGINEANLVRRVNLALDKRIVFPTYARYIKGTTAIGMLSRRRDTARIALPADRFDWFADRCRTLVEGLREAGYRVAGDLEELLPIPPDAQRPALDPDDPREDEMLDAGVQAIAKIVDRAQQEEHTLNARIDALHHERDALREERDTLRAERDRNLRELAAAQEEASALRAEITELRGILDKPPAKLFARRLSERHPTVKGARIAYWNIVEYGRRKTADGQS